MTLQQPGYVLQIGSFNLTEWILTHGDILASIPEEHRANSFEELLDKTTSKFFCRKSVEHRQRLTSFLAKQIVRQLKKKATQRNLLYTSQSVFDPIGIASPVLFAYAFCSNVFEDKESLETTMVATKTCQNV